MSKEQENKAIVTRWFEHFWGKAGNVAIVDELGTPDVLVHYPMHGPRRGREAVKRMMTEFRAAFPDLNFWAVGDLIAEGDYVVGRWDGGGTHTGPAFSDPPSGTSLRHPARRSASRGRPSSASRMARSRKNSARKAR